MFKRFRKKPIEIAAFQFTKKKHDYLKKSVLKNENENPVNIKLLDIPDAELQWNWFTQQLYVITSEGQMEINVGDWIIREPFNKERRYYPVKNEIFVQTYDAVIKSNKQKSENKESISILLYVNELFSNEAFITNVCLSYRHDYGLLSPYKKEILRFECKEWFRAIINNWDNKRIHIFPKSDIKKEPTQYLLDTIFEGLSELTEAWIASKTLFDKAAKTSFDNVKIIPSKTKTGYKVETFDNGKKLRTYYCKKLPLYLIKSESYGKSTKNNS